jgi:uncharacterized protein YuzE
MRLYYDQERDKLRIELSRGRAVRSENGHKGLEVGFGSGGELVSLEISEASRLVDDPKSVDLAVNGVNVRGMRMY